MRIVLSLFVALALVACGATTSTPSPAPQPAPTEPGTPTQPVAPLPPDEGEPGTPVEPGPVEPTPPGAEPVPAPPTTPPEPTPEPTPSPNEALSIGEYGTSTYDSDGTTLTYVFGLVKNTGNVTVTRYDVRATNRLSSEESPPSLSSGFLAPGETGHFGIVVSGTEVSGLAAVVLDTDASLVVADIDYSFGTVTEADGSVYIEGTFTNNESQTVTDMEAVFACRDASGSLVDVFSEFPGASLIPGASTTSTILIAEAGASAPECETVTEHASFE